MKKALCELNPTVGHPMLTDAASILGLSDRERNKVGLARAELLTDLKKAVKIPDGLTSRRVRGVVMTPKQRDRHQPITSPRRLEAMAAE